ncbi:MAG: carbohydrate kinase family protein [Chloroflexi bacterium]|nr:MAG: carbohydrate kinase family protein [Chloroflexota bacterium]
MRIAFSGSIAYDYLMTFPGSFKDHILPDMLERLSLSFLVDKMDRRPGGIAPNIAYNHALLGGDATIVGTVGVDFSGYRESLVAAGVKLDGVREVDGLFTASFFVTTDQDHAQIASFYSGAMAHSREVRLAVLKPLPDLVVISPDDPTTMRERVLECRASGVPYLYDPGQQIVRLDNEDLRDGIAGAHMLFVNDYEFGLLGQKLGTSVEQIVGRGTILVITKGAAGSVTYAEGLEHNAPAYPAAVEADPTGVGDAFRGGWLRGVAAGLSWDLCARVGALTATYCLEHVGPQGHRYSIAEFVERFRKVDDDRGALDVLLP